MRILKVVALLLPLAICQVQVAGQRTQKKTGNDPVASLKQAYGQASQAWRLELRQARRANTPRAQWPKNPAGQYFKKFQELADQAPPGSLQAGAGLAMMLKLAPYAGKGRQAGQKLQADIMQRLLDDHLQQPCIRAVVQRLGSPRGKQRKPAIASLNRIIAENDLPQIRAQALYAKATALASKYMPATDEDRAEARKTLRTLSTDYADNPLSSRVQSFLFELDHLQIGMKAPEFMTTDVDGVPFKLSDYRGKVVVLDFWGFW